MTKSKMQCDSDEACISNLTPKYFCNTTTNICEHESLSELSKEYIIGIILIVFISAFANAGGIGGGSVIVPVLTIMFAFEVNEAIPLSKATIFAGAVINVFFLLNERNEFDMNKFLIDYRLCSFMLPIMMCGTFFGVYLNFIVPPMIIIFLLTGYLMLSIFSIKKKYKILSLREDKKLGTTLSKQILDGFRNMTKYFSKDKEEELELEDLKDELGEDIENNENIQAESKTSSHHITEFKNRYSKKNILDEALSDTDNKSTYDDSMKTKEKEEQLKNRKPFKKLIKENMIYIIILISSIFIIMTLSLFKEGVFFSDKTEISRCSALGVTVIAIIATFCFFVSFMAFSFNIKNEKNELKKKLQKPSTMEDTIQEKDIVEINSVKNGEINMNSILTKNEKMNPEVLTEEQVNANIKNEIKKKKIALYKLGSVSFVAGVGAGLLGIGGGMIINPFLIIMNYSPLDATAISSMGVLFTSTISTSEFLIMKAIKLSDLNYFLIIAGIGSLSGVFIIKGLIDRFRRQSILLLIILGIFIFAVIVLPTFGILSIPFQNYFKFGNVCIQ